MTARSRLPGPPLSAARRYPGGHGGRDLSDLTPRRHEHLALISDRAHVAALRQGVLAFVFHWGEKLQPSFGSLLIYLHFIRLPAARPSSVVLWRAGGALSSLTNAVQIACRMTVGELLNLGHTSCFCCSFFLYPPFLHPPSPLLCLSGSVKWKNSCLTSFLARSPCLERAWCWGHPRQDAGSSRPSGQQHSPYLAGAGRNHVASPNMKEVFLQEMFACLFVFNFKLKHLHFLRREQCSDILTRRGESGCAACSWRWHSTLWYSNGVIHQQVLLKHCDKPAEATPPLMVTIPKADGVWVFFWNSSCKGRKSAFFRFVLFAPNFK